MTTATTTTVETTESGPRRATYESYETLVANASFSVPDPAVPSRFEFQSAIVMHLDDHEYVAMAYHDIENGSLDNVVAVRKAENESAYNLSTGNATRVGDIAARYVESDGGAKLLWECDGYVYRVSVQQYTDEFDETELRAVAESVGCE